MEDTSRRFDISRRNFVRLAVGSLMALPTVAGGFIVPAREALADSGGETNAGEADDATTKITLVFASEVGFYVADISKTEPEPVPGARVTVTSRYNDRKVEGTTGADGIVKLDIRNLAENLGNENVDQLSEYSFNGRIAMRADGYREFEVELTRIEGGGGLLVPTRPLSDGLPYPRTVSFNEWDALYTENEFLSTPSNTESHELSMEWRNLPSNAATTVRLLDRDTGEVLQQKTARPQGGTLTTSFEKPFLKKGGSDELPADTNFDVTLTQDDTSYLVPIGLITREGVTEEPAEEKEMVMSPLSYGMTELGVDWPLDVPLLGGTALKSFSPDCYANVSWNPWGYIQFTLKTPSWGYHNDTGTDPEIQKGWGVYPHATAAWQYNKMSQSAMKNVRSTQAAYDSAYAIPKISTFGTITAQGNFQLLALAKWDNDKHLMQGNAALQLFVGFSASYTWNYLVGPFPILVTLALDSNLCFSVSCGFYSTHLDKKGDMKHALFHPGTWKWDYTNTGFTITFNFVPSLSVGLGVRGVASVSVKGAVTITFVTAWDWRGKGNQAGKPRPHVFTGYGVKITVVIHAFLATATFKIKEVPFKTWWDNWSNIKSNSDLKAQSREEMLKAMADTGITAPMRKARLITSDMLERTVELDMDELEYQSLRAQQERETFDWQNMRRDDVSSELDDGRTIHYRVYSLKTDKTEPVDEALLAQSDAQVAEDAPEQGTEPTLEQGVVSIPEQGVASAPDNEADAVLGRHEVVARNMSSLSYRPRHGRAQVLRAQAYDPDRGSALPIPEPDELGIRGGIRPRSDMRINQPDEDGNPTYVFGDPRFKVVELRTFAEDTRIHATCVFRIGTVAIAGEPRSRLMMTILNAGVETGASGEVNLDDYIGITKVLDFDIDDVDDVDRVELFDYDFDVALTAEGDADIVRIAMVSGRRADGDKTKIASMMCDLYFTYLSFEANDVFGRFDYTHKVSMRGSDTFQGEPDDLFHSISNVRVATDGTAESPSLLIAYLDRICADPQKAVDELGNGVTTKLCFLLVDNVEEEILAPDREEVDAALGTLKDGTLHDLDLLPQTTVLDEGGTSRGMAYTVTLSSYVNDETYFYVLRLEHDEDGNPVFTSMKQAPMLESSMRLVYWPRHDCFLTTYPNADYLRKLDETGLWMNPLEWDRSQWVLQKAWWVEEQDSPWDPTLTTPVLHFKQIGPDGFALYNFGVNSSGSFIFWPQTRDADDGEYGSRRVFEGDGTYSDEPEPAIHHLMACRINFEEFSDPFIVADVEHEMNALQVVRTNDRLAPLEILSSEFVDLGDRDDEGAVIYHASNVWYTSIPNLRCATATGCTSPVPLVAPGGTIKFHVTVRNDGNSYLSGCTLQLCVHEDRVLDGEGNVVSERVSEVPDAVADVTFDEKTLVVSCWNPIENGVMQNVEPDFSLAPGKRGVYTVEVKIPATWGADGEDEKWVSFVAKEPVVADGGSLTAQDEEAIYQEFSIEPGTFRPYRDQMTPETDREQTFMQVIQVQDAVADGIITQDTPVTYATDGETPPPAPYEPGADIPPRPDGGDSKTPSSRPGEGGGNPQTPARPINGGTPVTYGGVPAPWPQATLGGRYRPYGYTTSRAYDDSDDPGDSGSSSSGTAGPAGNATPVTPVTPVTQVTTGGSAPQGSSGATAATGGAAAPAAGTTTGGTPSTSVAGDPKAGGASAAPHTADDTRPEVAVAAALAGAALVAAGATLAHKDHEDEEA